MAEITSFGNTLRLARERRGLSQEEAAKALCLNVEVINALECEQFDKLPSPVFVRGYIKNYASLLRLTINEPSSKASVAVKDTESSSPHQKRRIEPLLFFGKPSFKVVNYLVMIILAVLVFVWWHERHHAVEKTDATHSIINMSDEIIPFKREQSSAPLFPIKEKQSLMKEVFPGWPL